MTVRWRLYQTVLKGGEIVNVADMTADQLRDALCDCYDLLEKVEDAASQIATDIDTWRGRT